MEGAISHDQLNWMLTRPEMTLRHWWRKVKPEVQKIERTDGVIVVDNTIVEKVYTDEDEIIDRHNANRNDVKSAAIFLVIYGGID